MGQRGQRVMDRMLVEAEVVDAYIAYTDGSNDNYSADMPAGAAYVILDSKGNELHRASKGFMGKTNNYVELMAIISAVNWIPEGASVIVYSDSQYAINLLSGRFRNVKANKSLVEKYFEVSKGKNVFFQWVRGHNGNYWNEVVDKMANAEFQKMR